MLIRYLADNIIDNLDSFRILYIDGARQSGKTTLVKQIASRKNYTYISFDDMDKFALAKKNPALFFSMNNPPLVIDEVQKVPDIINQIKLIVDNNPTKKGQFILTGSIDIIKSANINESLAGRLVGHKLYPLSAGEINSNKNNWLDMLFLPDFYKHFTVFKIQNTMQIINRLLIGGFPELQNVNPKKHNQWFANYIKARIDKDVRQLTKYNLQKADKLPLLLKLLSNQTSDLLNKNSLAKKLMISHDTVDNYLFLLHSTFLIEDLPPFEANMGRHVKKMRKVYFTDTGMIKYLSKINTDKLNNDQQLFGKLLETYIYTEIKKLMGFSTEDYDIYYYRDNKAHEVDFIIENSKGDTICIEVKSAQRLTSGDLKGLRSFKRNYHKGILAMYVFYGGNEISALNIDDDPVYLIPYAYLF